MLTYNDLIFEEREDKIRVLIYGLFYKEFARQQLKDELGDFAFSNNKIIINGMQAEDSNKKFMQFFRKYKRDLTYKINGNKAIFVDEDLGMPLIGLYFLGIVDKGSEILEIKPITNCNASCSFCSVDEGFDSKKEVDFVVDKGYLVSETKAVLAYKDAFGMSLWINPHGEPTLYAKLAEYCDDMLEDGHVKDIHIITNGLLLNQILVDKLAAIAEKHQKKIAISLSISGLGKEKLQPDKLNKKGLPMAKLMMGESYNVDHVLKNLVYMAERLPVKITPVLVPGMNEDEIEPIIGLAKRLSAKNGNQVHVAVQKFCTNRMGRNPVQEQGWDVFFQQLTDIGQQTGVVLKQPLGKLQETRQLPLLCKKGDNIKVRVLCDGRFQRDRIAVYETTAGKRAVLAIGCEKNTGMVKVKVLQHTHNLVIAK